MRPNVHSLYVEFLHCAAERVKAGDRIAAMFCLTQAMRAANTAHDARYRRAVFRAMSFARRLP
jgi:hypothetical protein